MLRCVSKYSSQKFPALPQHEEHESACAVDCEQGREREKKLVLRGDEAGRIKAVTRAEALDGFAGRRLLTLRPET